MAHGLPVVQRISILYNILLYIMLLVIMRVYLTQPRGSQVSRFSACWTPNTYQLGSLSPSSGLIGPVFTVWDSSDRP